MPLVIQLLFENYTVRQSMFIISGVYAHTFIGVGKGIPISSELEEFNSWFTSYETVETEYAGTHPWKALTPEVRKSKKKTNVKLTSIMNPSIIIYVIGLFTLHENTCRLTVIADLPTNRIVVIYCFSRLNSKQNPIKTHTNCYVPNEFQKNPFVWRYAFACRLPSCSPYKL